MSKLRGGSRLSRVLFWGFWIERLSLWIGHMIHMSRFGISLRALELYVMGDRQHVQDVAEVEQVAKLEGNVSEHDV